MIEDEAIIFCIPVGREVNLCDSSQQIVGCKLKKLPFLLCMLNLLETHV